MIKKLVALSYNIPNMKRSPVSKKKETAIKGLIDHALSEVERKYGTGKGDGDTPKSYHNQIHTQGMMNAARKIAQLALEAGKISDSDILLIEIAASFHEIEQDLGRGLNEKESAKIAEEEMREIGLFGNEDIQKVRAMILATTVYFEAGIMRQSPTEEYLTQIVADADLSSLGQEQNIYWEEAKGLLKEIKKTDSPSREDEIAFVEKELTILENHQFYTEEARKLFPHKEENIMFILKQTKS